MRIGIIAHIKHPIRKPFVGGLEAFTHDISQRLIDRGHDVVLFASSLSDKNLPIYPILNDANYDEETGIRKQQKDMSSEYIAEHHAYQTLMQEIDDMGFDVIFNNSLHYVPVTMSGVLSTPIVTVLHTPPFYELTNAIKHELRTGSIHYLTVSEKNAQSWNIILPDCKWIENGIDLSLWKPETERSDKYAVWFGRIHPDKGTHLAIQACRMADIPLKLAGNISDKKYYQKQVEPLLNDHIEYLGPKDHTQLNELIAKAIVSVITPSWEEPFGLVVAESIACGTPVAGFAKGALPDLIDETSGRLVSHGDITALAEAIKEASALNRSTVRKYAETRFSIDNMMDAYESLLKTHCKKDYSHSA